MKAANNISVLFVLMVAVTVFYVSCTRNGNVVLPATPPKLVLHAYTKTGDTFEIALGRTFKSQGELVLPDNTFIERGWAVVYEGNKFLDSLDWDSAGKRYIASHAIAEAGKTYVIKAGAPGFTSIEASSYAPGPVFLSSLVRTKNARKDVDGIPLDDIAIRFRDPSGENNFYLAELHSQVYTPTCVYTYDPSVERFTPDVLAFQDAFCIAPHSIMYTDRTFNGQIKEITLSMQANVLDSVVDQGTIRRPYITRYNITEDYYRYFLGTSNDGFFLEEGPSFTTPAITRGNVKNGYGLFTIFSAVTDTIR